MRLLQFPLLILVPFIIVSCTNDKKDSQTLSLALIEEDSLSVSDYQVLDKPFIKSQQQGRYQAHLLDAEEEILQKISFDKMELPSAEKSNNANFYVALPLLSEAAEIEIYRLDGSSGHYQLKSDNPLLSWQVPDELGHKSQ